MFSTFLKTQLIIGGLIGAITVGGVAFFWKEIVFFMTTNMQTFLATAETIDDTNTELATNKGTEIIKKFKCKLNDDATNKKIDKHCSIFSIKTSKDRKFADLSTIEESIVLLNSSSDINKTNVFKLILDTKLFPNINVAQSTKIDLINKTTDHKIATFKLIAQIDNHHKNVVANSNLLLIKHKLNEGQRDITKFKCKLEEDYECEIFKFNTEKKKPEELNFAEMTKVNKLNETDNEHFYVIKLKKFISENTKIKELTVFDSDNSTKNYSKFDFFSKLIGNFSDKSQENRIYALESLY